MSAHPHIRLIEAADIQVVDKLIRQVMNEFACIGPGYSINDPEMENIYAAYQGTNRAFYVIELDGEILGCGGFAPLSGGDQHTCELRKMYFLSRLRGFGMGKKILNLCISEARSRGFKKMYLETVKRMEAANHLYQKRGFIRLKASKGKTGHSGCDAFYELDLCAAGI